MYNLILLIVLNNVFVLILGLVAGYVFGEIKHNTLDDVGLESQHQEKNGWYLIPLWIIGKLKFSRLVFGDGFSHLFFRPLLNFLKKV